jgi:hypothetical protein
MLIYKNPSSVNIRRNLTNTGSAQNTSVGISTSANQKKKRLPTTSERRLRADRRYKNLEVPNDRRSRRDRRGTTSSLYKSGTTKLENIEERLGTRLSIEA